MDLQVSLRRLAAACCVGVGAMLAFAAPAAAQDASCPELVAPAEVPDGSTATRAEMQEAEEAYRAWGEARLAALTCYREAAAPLVERNRARSEAHDAGARYLNAVSAAWRAQVDAFNAREGGPPTEGAPVQMPTAPAGDESTCAVMESAPQMPMGASATREQIQAYNALYDAWGAAFQTALQCRATIVREGDAQAQPLVQTHNDGNEELARLNAAWEAEIAEFAARPARERRR